MKPRAHILTPPLLLNGELRADQVSSLVAIDALHRNFAEAGNDARWEVTALTGGAVSQSALRKRLNRANAEDDSIERREAESANLARTSLEQLQSLLDELHVNAQVRTQGDELAQAARVAFVRLYDAGLISRFTGVQDTCPTCETVLDEQSVSVVERDVVSHGIHLECPEGEIEVVTRAPELLLGAVAVAVSPDHPAAWSMVKLPVVDREVQVISVADLETPRFVVPAYDKWSWELGRELGLDGLHVVNGRGEVTAEGPYEGMGRFAVREFLLTQLEAVEALVSAEHTTQAVRVCARCAAHVLPMQGAYWMLDLSTLLADAMQRFEAAVDAGEVVVSPVEALDELRVFQPHWCISQSYWGGERIPVWKCLDCGQVKALVTDKDSCGACMGSLEQFDDVLDVRFLSCVSPLVSLGWPNAITSPAEHNEASQTVFLADYVALRSWVQPTLALAELLVGDLLFDRLVVHDTPDGSESLRVVEDYLDLARLEGHEVARATALLGENVDRAKEVVSLLAEPAPSTLPADSVEVQVASAVSEANAGEALIVLADAAARGSASAEVIIELSRPLLGMQETQASETPVSEVHARETSAEEATR